MVATRRESKRRRAVVYVVELLSQFSFVVVVESTRSGPLRSRGAENIDTE